MSLSSSYFTMRISKLALVLSILATSFTIATAAQAATVPSAPQTVSVTSGDASLAVEWLAPSSDGSDESTSVPVLSYTAYASDGTSTFSCTTTLSVPTCTISGLTNGTSYAVTVTATNDLGEGTASSPVNATPAVPNTSPPTSPRNVTVTSGDGQLFISWLAPADKGGDTSISYYVTANDGTSLSACSVTTDLTCTITELTNGVTYSVAATASSNFGTSDPTSAVYGIPCTIPGAPTNLAITRSFGSLSATWSEPSDTGSSVTGYTITGVPDDSSGDITCSWTSGALICDFVEFSNAAIYTFTAVTTNGAGSSSPSTSVVSEAVVRPGAPSITSITAANHQLTLAITAGAVGGAAITDYLYSFDNGVTYASFGTATGPFVITGLVNGFLYRVSVAAVNSYGASTFSSRVNGVPATTPTAPRWLRGTRGNGTATLLWNPPASNGGLWALNYTVSDHHGHGCTTTAMTCTVTGLTNGVSYLFYVVATNSQGSSAESNSNRVTPATTPSAPGITSVVAGNKKIVVTLTPPTNTGGAAIGYYIYSVDGGATWRSGQYHTTTTTVGSLSGGLPTTRSVLTIVGLTNGTTYSVKVRAANIAGVGAASVTTTVVPFNTPGKTTIQSVSTTATSATVNFAAPGTGGRAITTYQYSLNNTNIWVTRSSGTTASPLVITGLVSKNFYSVQVRAVSSAGAGLPSAPFRFQTK